MVTRNGDNYTFRTRCDRADSVFLLGDFNNWSTTATPMRSPDAGRTWQADVRLRPGTYRFAYFVVNDPARPHPSSGGLTRVVTDGGNSVLSVPLER